MWRSSVEEVCFADILIGELKSRRGNALVTYAERLAAMRSLILMAYAKTQR
jgi:hypothetical protein